MSDPDVHALKFLPLEERGDPRFAPPETELVRWMYTIEPGETRVWRAPASAPNSVAAAPSFWRMATRGDFPFDALSPLTPYNEHRIPRYWSQKHPDLAPDFARDAVTLHYRYHPGTKLADVYDQGPHAIVSDVVLGCINELDPDCLDVRECAVDGLENGRKFYSVVPKRIWDVVDPTRTSVNAKCKAHASGRSFRAYAFVPSPPLGQSEEIHLEGVFLREGIPEGVHLIRGLWRAELFVSARLLELIQSRGATGIYFMPPEPNGYSRRVDI